MENAVCEGRTQCWELVCGSGVLIPLPTAVCGKSFAVVAQM